ncbi:S-layer homology domain-containing protein [Paenibacillus silvestris]|nr:S-layer homology domain-containing protein [Paenibacillus silvestris]
MRFNRFIIVLLMFTMMVSTAMPVFVSGAEKVELKDTQNSYAMKEIDALIEAGIVSGYEDGSFQPQKAMTRAELAKILVLSLGAKEDPTKAEAFLDVEANSWYRGYVGALVASGITQGTSLTTFSPDANVTREELVVFFIRALGLEEAAAKLPIVGTFSDKDQIADWARNQVSFASQIGFIQGTEGPDSTLLFNPKQNAERQALARLAFEFKTNASQYVEKAKALVNGQKGSIISSIEAVSNTSIEVTFSSELASVNTSDFAFDNDLQVVDAVFKSGSKSIVVLTTSTQTKDVVYKLSFKGTTLDKSVLGVAGIFGGGGGGGGFGGGGGAVGTTVEQLLASGKEQGTITVKASGTYGPVSGSATTVENLILDPGPSGEVTLRNINPQQLQVLSGSVNSIKLQNTIVKQLKVNAVNNNGNSVRIEVRDGASVEDTEVSSQAILESASTQGTFGKIKLNSSAEGKQITLKGNIDGEVTVEAPGAKIKLDAPTSGNSLPTVIKSLKLKSNAEINAGPGTAAEDIYVTEGTSVTVTGDPETVWKLSNGNSALQIGDQVKGEAIKLANEAISKFFSSTGFESQLVSIENTDRAIAIAQKYGANDYDFSSLRTYKEMRQAVLDLNDLYKSLQLQFQPGDTASSVTKDIIYPTPSGNDITVVWSSDRPDLLTSWTPLERPASGEGDATVTIKATLYKMAYAVTKEFVIKVKQYDSKVASAKSVRSDLVLVSFDHPVVNSRVSDFQIDHSLSITNVTQYPHLKNYVLLTVGQQTKDTNYRVTYKQKDTNISFVGSTENTCSETVCPLPSAGPISVIPIPGVNVPGMVAGRVIEETESGTSGIQNAKVELIGTDRSVLTSADGSFIFEQVAPGKPYTIRVSKDKYSKAQTGQFTISSGQPYSVGFLSLHTAPKSVVDLKAMVSSATEATLSWSPGSWINTKTTSYQVHLDGRKIADLQGLNYSINTLKENQAYTISVVACNDVGCAAPTTISVQTPITLHIDQIRPYNSVTNTVYNPLDRTQTGLDQFKLPKASSSADYMLVRLKDSDYVPNAGPELLKGVLDTSKAKLRLTVHDAFQVTGKVETIGGVSYYKISFYNQPFPLVSANPYDISGLKYLVNGQTLEVAPLQYAITFE